jgi:uncharacterized YceG family protein
VAEWRERTAEEREAARVERERRRAAEDSNNHAAAPADAVPVEDSSADGHHEWDDEDEVAAGTRRVGWRERARGASPAPRARARTRPVGRRRSLLGRLIAVLALLLAAAIAWFCIELFQPFHGTGHGHVTVTIPRNSTTGQVGNLLERDGVIASGFFFKLRAELAGDRGKLLAGTYHLKLDMSYSRVLTVLTTPPPAAKVTEVTIVPGETRRQLDALLRSQGVKGSYLATTRSSPLLPLSAYGAPRKTPSLEGFLFPDTYQLRVPVSLGTLVADQLKAFRRDFGRVRLSYARSHGLTPYDVLIIASIVEKEAATSHDRPLVASVIYNRLKDHIPLGMDSTTRYEFNDYNKPLTRSQLASPSPYNTRLHAGLPPTPISNPGLAAIEAAADPARTNFLYFVVKPGTCGSVFTSNYNQFLADSARYQLARARKGGRSPTKC